MNDSFTPKSTMNSRQPKPLFVIASSITILSTIPFALMSMNLPTKRSTFTTLLMIRNPHFTTVTSHLSLPRVIIPPSTSLPMMNSGTLTNHGPLNSPSSMLKSSNVRFTPNASSYWVRGGFLSFLGVVSYRLRILMYCDVSCMYPVGYTYLECILMYLKCILNALLHSKRIHV